MATKIKLGQRPESFKRIVKFALLDGSEGLIEIDYIYRTRSEFGRLVDELFDAGQQATQDEKFSLASVMSRTSATNADYILKIARGWNLDEPFERSALEQLSDEIPAAVAAIMEQYRIAITEGRLGN